MKKRLTLYWETISPNGCICRVCAFDSTGNIIGSQLMHIKEEQSGSKRLNHKSLIELTEGERNKLELHIESYYEGICRKESTCLWL